MLAGFFIIKEDSLCSREWEFQFMEKLILFFFFFQFRRRDQRFGFLHDVTQEVIPVPRQHVWQAATDLGSSDTLCLFSSPAEFYHTFEMERSP